MAGRHRHRAPVRAVTYTATQQTSDFGAPKASITVRVHQISATVGRGFPGEAVL